MTSNMAQSTSSVKVRDFLVGVLFSFMVLFSLWALTSQVRDVVSASSASGWPTVDGAVVSSQVNPGCKNLTGYVPFIRYQYTVRGQEYTSHRIAYGAGVCSSKSDVERIVNAYPEGKTVQVYFDPASPGDSTLNASRTGAGTFPVFIIALLIFFISAPIAYHYIKLCLPPRS